MSDKKMEVSDSPNTDVDILEISGVHEEADSFVWQDYLEVTNSTEVPGMLFSHVEQSLMNGLEEGMILEVPLKDPHKFYLARIVMACGPLLRMRYVGQSDDRSREFWCDLTKIVVHPVGWCKSQGVTLSLPEELADLSNWEDVVEEAIRNSRHAPAQLLTGEGLTPVDCIKEGMKLEVQSAEEPHFLWVATIMQNVGGRLLMCYDTPGISLDKFWLFYTSPRLFRVGWAAEQGDPWKLVPPSGSGLHMNEEWMLVLETAMEENQRLPLPPDLFQSKPPPLPHSFHVGMKLEAVNPVNMCDVCPSTVVKVLNSSYFLVQIDSYRQDEAAQTEQPEWLCTRQHPYIFPVGWSSEHSIPLRPPRGWPTPQLDWSAYLCACKSIAAPKACFQVQPVARRLGFRTAQKLEAAHAGRICAATISKVIGHLLWLHIEANTSDHPSHVVSHDSTEIFPVGWCESNGYPLVPPRYYHVASKPDSLDEPRSNASTPPPSRSSWCPKIYFNHKCFSGPFLSKGKLAQLPRSVGPGPVALVMHEVLAMLISVAYISSRVLKVLQVDGARPARGTHLEVLKAKYKGNTYRANVAIVTSADNVTSFCRDVCQRLQVCPHLFGPTAVAANSCPEHCHMLSKTKFNQTWSSAKQPIGRPKGSVSNIVAAQNSRRKTKRKRLYFTSQKMCQRSVAWNKASADPIITKDDFESLLQLAEGSSTDPAPPTSAINSASGIKRKYNKKKLPLVTEIQTRGAQLPKYSKHWSRGGRRRGYELVTVHGGQSNVGYAPDAEAASKHPIVSDFVLKLPKYLGAITLETNPLMWSVKDVATYLRGTDCQELAELCKAELIDGHAFMLLNLPTMQCDLRLKRAEALKLCHHVEQVKLAFYIQYKPER